jgi:hypothetical protein
MKKVILCLSLLTSQISLAEIANSKHEIRHQRLIEKAIEETCGPAFDLREDRVKTVIIRVDQGITDKKFETIISGEIIYDQISLPHTIRVSSEYADMYDHSLKVWGVYTVTNVGCIYNN